MLINFFGLISQDEWEQAETVFKLLALNVSIATAKLKNVQTGKKDEVTDVLKSEMVSIENQIHSLEEKLSAEAIRAPIGGIVLDSYQAGTLCSIANIDTMMVEVPIDPKNRYYIEPGMKFEVKMPALANQPLSGEIISVGQNAQIVTTQYDFYYEKLDGIMIRKKNSDSIL